MGVYKRGANQKTAKKKGHRKWKYEISNNEIGWCFIFLHKNWMFLYFVLLSLLVTSLYFVTFSYFM